MRVKKSRLEPLTSYSNPCFVVDPHIAARCSRTNDLFLRNYFSAKFKICCETTTLPYSSGSAWGGRGKAQGSAHEFLPGELNFEGVSRIFEVAALVDRQELFHIP